MEKERLQRDKNGKMNNVAFYAVSSSSPYGYLCPKLEISRTFQQYFSHIRTMSYEVMGSEKLCSTQKEIISQTD